MKFCIGKLQRARKREHDGSMKNSSIVKTQSCTQQQALKKNYCLLYSWEDRHLHNFQTLDAEVNRSRMTRDLQDKVLLTRIDDGDLATLEAQLSQCTRV